MLAGQAVQGLPSCGKNFRLYVEGNEEPWKDLNLQVKWSGLCLQQSLLTAENGGL